jgi:hypothetical protein
VGSTPTPQASLKTYHAMGDMFIRWLASELAAVLTTPVARNQRQQRCGAFIASLVKKLPDMPMPERREMMALLTKWEHQKAIDGHQIPRDDETMDWMEEIVGSIDGLIEDDM